MSCCSYGKVREELSNLVGVIRKKAPLFSEALSHYLTKHYPR